MFKTPTVKEQVREAKKEVTHAQRGLDREKRQLETEEKKLVAQIKDSIKKGRDSEAKIYAKQLVQVRQSMTRMTQMNAQMGAIKTKAVMAGATQTMYVTYIFVSTCFSFRIVVVNVDNDIVVNFCPDLDE